MANTNKTKSEMLQELESIKGLLLENDDIPLLQEIEEMHPPTEPHKSTQLNDTVAVAPQPTHSLSHTQTSLFDDEPEASTPITSSESTASDKEKDVKTESRYTVPARPIVKAAGENPFLPQHIRERLHGNNPPPLYAYESAKKILNSTKMTGNKHQRPRQQLIDDIIDSMMPHVESELRHRLFAMSADELESLLKNQD